MYLRNNPFRFVMLASIAGLSMLIMIASAHGESGRITFDISSQPLSNALVQFSHSTGVQFLYTEENVSTTKVRGVSGQHSVEEGLDELLEGTGYRYEFTNPNTVRIFEEGAASGQSGIRRETQNVILAQAASDAPAGEQAPVAARQRAASRQITFEELVVTAQKRAQNIQDVPISMQAFTGEQIRNQHVNKLTDVVRLAPNLNVAVQNALSQHIVIRGVGTNEFFGNAPSSVGMYMDEVTMNSSYMSTLGLFDMERVEVLRGPQNSLFGRNTTGGAVNYISRKPVVSGGYEGYVVGTYGRHDLFELEGGVSLPVADTLAVRLAGFVRARDGLWHNLDTGNSEYGDEDRYSIRGTAVWEPTSATRVTLSFHHARDDSQAQPQRLAGALINDPPLRENDLFPFEEDITFLEDLDLVNIEGFDHATTDWHDIYVGGSQRADLKVDGGYIKVDHDFGPILLTSISAYDQTHAFYEEDNTGNGNVVGGVNTDVLIIDMDQKYKQFSQELRLSSTDDAAPFRWIAGVYYFRQDSLLAQSIRFGSNGFPGAHPSNVGITPPELFDVIPNPFENTASFSIADLKDESISVYGQVDYDLTRRLTATVGLRYTNDDKANPSYFAGGFDKTGIDPATFYDREFIEMMAADLPPCPDLSVPGNLPFSHCADNTTTRENLKENQVGGKVGLKYQASDEVMVFGSYSRGFKSGKFDVEFLHTNATPFPQRPLDVEILNTFEVGFKSTLMEQRLQVNGAVFVNLWKDQQVFNVGVNGPEFFNLPKSRIIGGELEMSFVPAPTWLITGSLGLLDSKITDATGIDFDLGQGDFQEGHELALVPNVTANGGIRKEFDIGPNLLTLQANLRYQSTSKAKYSPQPPIDEYDSRFEIDARASYALGQARRYELSIYGKNLTGEKYCLEKQDLRGVAGSVYCVPNLGQAQYGVEMRANF